MTKELLLNENIINQFDCKKLKSMIETFISMIRLMQFRIGDISSIKVTSSYEMKFSMYKKPTASGIESFLIRKYDTEEKVIECISLYTDAFNDLTMLEQEIFVKTFFNKDSSIIYCDSYKRDLYPRELTKIRKSAIVKFAVKLKFYELNYEEILGEKKNV